MSPRCENKIFDISDKSRSYKSFTERFKDCNAKFMDSWQALILKHEGNWFVSKYKSCK